MSVTITPTVGVLYTWASGGFAWADPRAGRSWANSGVISYAADVQEAFAAQEALARSKTHKIAETLTAQDILGKQTTKPIAEVFAIQEAHRRDAIKNSREALAVAETVVRGTLKGIAESLLLSESLTRQITLSPQETLAVVEVLAKNGTISQFEALALLEVFSFHRTLMFYEGFRLSDDVRRDVIFNAIETLAVSEHYADLIAYYLRFFESLAFDEVRACNRAIRIDEAFAITEQLAKAIGKGHFEALAMAELVTRQLALNKGETLGVAETTGRDFVKPVSESFGISEVAARNLDKNVSEVVALLEALSKQSIRGIVESFALGETAGKTRSTGWNETLGVQEGFKKIITKAVVETVGVAELFGRTTAYQLAIAEGIAVADAAQRAMTLTRNEALAVFEEYPRKANSVISDMILSTDDLTLDMFKSVVDAGHAPGYQPFRDFIPGDYTYQKALFRTIMESKNSDRAKLTQLRVTVDVPDVFDRGTATITDAQNGIRVDFNRTFYTPPEVTITLKGGTTFALPRVLSVDETGFTAVLRDPDSSANVTGTFTWAAHGY